MKRMILALLVTFSLIGCNRKEVSMPIGSSGSGDDWFPKENISLRWSFFCNEAEWPFWMPGIEAYEREHPNVKFTIENTPWSQYWDKLATQVASNTVPDITGMTTGTSRMFLANGSLLDLTPYMERDSKDPNSGWKTDDYWEGVFWGYTLNGKIYGVPYDMGPNAICINIALFEEFGVPLPKDGWTFDEMKEIAKKLTVDRDKDGVTDVYGLSWTPTDSNFYDNFVLSLGSKFIYGTEPNQTVDVSPITAKYVQFLCDGLKEGWNYSETSAEELGLFESGKIAMITSNPQHFGQYAKTMTPKPRLYAIESPMSGDPKYDTGTKYIGGGGFSASAKTKYPDVCWDFLKNYLNEEGIKIVTAVPFRGIPPLKSLLDVFYNSEYAPENPQALTAFLTDGRENYYYTCPNWNQIRDAIALELNAAYAGMKTADEAIKQIVAVGNRVVREPE
jgi:multiple sugar transport system substrate-binding protein